MNREVSPVDAANRIILLDLLRGFALFGILIVNMQYFYRPMTHVMAGGAEIIPAADQLWTGFIKFFFESKFYVLFSFLFGYGFWLFLNKKNGPGEIVPLFRMRLSILLLFGVLHITLLWAGDILFIYSLFGFFLLLFRKSSDRSLIKWAVGLIAVPVALLGIGAMVVGLANLDPEGAAAMSAAFSEAEAEMAGFVAAAYETYSTGTFSEITVLRIREYVMITQGALFMFYPMVLAMFLVGMWTARRGALARYHENLPFFRKVQWWGLGIGIALNSIFLYGLSRMESMIVPDIWTLISTSGQMLGGVALSGFYVSTLVILFAKGKLDGLARYLAPAGRMALTNYLLHSIICTTLFLSYGFGFYAQITVFQGILLTILIFLLQIPFSIYWLEKFHYGPFEWLWRSLTYMKWQPFRKKIPPAVRIA